jgi:hypothetical protein
MTDDVTVLRLFDPPAPAPVDRLSGMLTARALRLVLRGIDETRITQELLELARGDEHTVATAIDRCRFAA